jgi:hypothetical protein
MRQENSGQHEGRDRVMTEQEFWLFLENSRERGRIAMVSAESLGIESPEMASAAKYLGGHAMLPEGYEKIPVGLILEMGELLAKRPVHDSTKEAILMLLAHHGSDEALHTLKNYVRDPDSGLEIFAELALQECEMWNEDWHSRRG